MLDVSFVEWNSYFIAYNMSLESFLFMILRRFVIIDQIVDCWSVYSSTCFLLFSIFCVTSEHKTVKYITSLISSFCLTVMMHSVIICTKKAGNIQQPATLATMTSCWMLGLQHKSTSTQFCPDTLIFVFLHSSYLQENVHT